MFLTYNSHLSKYGYTYDALGRRADRTQTGSAFAKSNKDTFAYNTRSEVLGSTNDVLTGSAHNPAYAYDPIGNRSGNTVDLNGTIDYTPNQLNQYSSVGSHSPVYDEDGNLTASVGNWIYQWDNENRLSNASNGSTSIDFVYDYQGRLVKKDDGSNVEVYLYDNWNRIASFTLQTSQLTLHTSYLLGLDLSGTLQGAGGVGGLLKESEFDSNSQLQTSHFCLYDANGNITQKLDNVGNVVMNVAYDPFGNVVSGTLTGEYGFSTKPLVDGVDWYYYGFRYYDPVMGRWPSRDPIGEQGFHVLRTQVTLTVGVLLHKAKVAELAAYLTKGLKISFPEFRSYLGVGRRLESFYSFVSNNGINQYDYLGLTGCTGIDPVCKDICDKAAATCMEEANDNYQENLALCIPAIVGGATGVAACILGVTNAWANELTDCNDDRNDCLSKCGCVCTPLP